MKVVSGDMYLELPDLVQAGIGVSRILAARQRKSSGYTFIDDPSDRRRVLVHYSTLKAEVKAVVDAKCGHLLTNTRRAFWATLVASKEDTSALRSHVLADGSSLGDEQVERLARACALLSLLDRTPRRTVIAWGYANVREWMDEVLAYITTEKMPLPRTYTRLMQRVREYVAQGALAVVSEKYGNQCARKIGPAQSDWLVATAAQPTKPDHFKIARMYSETCEDKGWPVLSPSAVYAHLHQPEVMQLWYLGRHGKEAHRNRYAHTLSLHGPTYRDALWCSDGTKLNYFYLGADGKQALLKVYLVMDVYSEVVLGHSVDTKEDFKAQFTAFKQALTFAAHKPAQVLYDNQSGHKKKETQDFFDRATALHFPAKPYNAKSKPIESLIGRMQKQVMKDRWFFTGQNIKSRSLDSRPNMDFILDSLEKLPTAEQVLRYVEQDIAEWNSMPHPAKQLPRMQVYQESVNPQPRALDFMAMVDLFWHTTVKPVTYTNQGLKMELGGERLQYEVYDADGHVNMEFMRRYTQAKFRVKYDPENLAHVRLYKEDESGDLRFVAGADRKKTYARAAVDLIAGERSEISALLQMRKDQEAATESELAKVRERSGVDPRMLLEAGHRMGDKDAAHEAASNATPLPVLVYRDGSEAPEQDDDDYSELNVRDMI